jgi:hypothetical protein
MEEQVKKAFDFAADLVKQLISLATGIIALTITFSKDFLQSTSAPSARPFAMIAWSFFVMSILCGIWALMSLTGTLDQKCGSEPVPVTIRGANVVIPSALQILFFVGGLVMTIVFAVKAA